MASLWRITGRFQFHWLQVGGVDINETQFSGTGHLTR